MYQRIYMLLKQREFHNRFSQFLVKRNFAKNAARELDVDIPIKFSTSDAARWSNTKTTTGSYGTILWYQPLVVSASVGVFLIYFLYLREENDFDRNLDMSLIDRFKEIEERENIKINIQVPPGITLPDTISK